MSAIHHEISFGIGTCNYLAEHGWLHAAAFTDKIDVRNYKPKEAA
jgi:hypothetical protein